MKGSWGVWAQPFSPRAICTAHSMIFPKYSYKIIIADIKNIAFSYSNNIILNKLVYLTKKMLFLNTYLNEILGVFIYKVII